MKTYLISYDLRVPETSEDYKKLIEHIKTYTHWAKGLYSVWFVKTGKTVSEVRDAIISITDANDRVLVVGVTNADWAAKGLPDKVTDWMQKM